MGLNSNGLSLILVNYRKKFARIKKWRMKQGLRLENALNTLKKKVRGIVVVDTLEIRYRKCAKAYYLRIYIFSK